MTHLDSPRVRYPLRAKLAVALAALVTLAELATFALFMMPMIPLVPVFVLTMLGNAFVVADVVHWAASQGVTAKRTVPRGKEAGHAQDARAPQVARAAT